MITMPGRWLIKNATSRRNWSGSAIVEEHPAKPPWAEANMVGTWIKRAPSAFAIAPAAWFPRNPMPTLFWMLPISGKPTRSSLFRFKRVPSRTDDRCFESVASAQNDPVLGAKRTDLKEFSAETCPESRGQMPVRPTVHGRQQFVLLAPGQRERFGA